MGEDKKSISLGQAIAYLKSNKSIDKKRFENLSDKDLDFINDLYDRAETLSDAQKYEAFIKNIQTAENGDNGTIEPDDIFLSLFLSANPDKECQELVSALNNQLKLFEEFSQVFNDFIAQYEVLQKKNGNL